MTMPQKTMQFPVRSCTLALLPLLLAACVGNAPAPVSDRSPSGAAATAGKVDANPPVTPAPVVARPGYYIVKPGDTLIRIGLEHGQNYRDIAAWNNLENPNLIEVGQELRVRPPETVAPARPASTTVVPNDGVKREPKGGKQPYSEAAWAQAQKPEAAPAKPVPAVPVADPKPEVAKPDPKPEAKSEVKPPKPEPRPEDNKGGDENLEWAWPAQGKIIASFSDTSSKGIDLGGKLGDPVFAAAGGKVVYAGTGLRGYGKLVIVKHDSNYLSAYAHNQNLLVKEGQAVSKGQRIAELGDTDSDKPKLHFEIRRQGKPVDPSKYLPSR